MRFAFTDDQLMLRDAVRDYLTKEYTAVQVRDAWAGASVPTPTEGRIERPVWSALAEMGVVGLLVPEADGGMGMDVLDQVLLLEETGRVALADPIVETAAVAAPLLGDLAPELNRADWLTAIVSGWSTVAVDLPVEGVAVPFVVDADRADLLVAARGDRLVAMASGALTTVAQPSVDGARRLFEVSWDPAAEILLAEGPAATAAIAAAFDRGALGTAAQLLGLADRALELTVGYVQERRQFGVPIGSFQAVKHHLADALLHLEFARPVVYRAAYSVATGAPDAARDVSMAKAYASDAALLVARKALQCHGAIGYTVEYDLHLWMKRIWALAASWGDAAWHRERVAATILPTHPPD